MAGMVGKCLYNTRILFTWNLFNAYWHFILVFSILAGVGMSLLFTPCFAIVGHWFNLKRGNATGIAATGGAFGGIVFPLVLRYTFPQLGFAWSTRILGFICIFFCIIANLLMVAHLPPSRISSSARPDIRIFKEPAFLFMTVSFYFVEWALNVPVAYITSYALSEGYSSSLAYNILPIMNAGSVFRRWLSGLFSDSLGQFNTMLITSFLVMITCYIIWLGFGSHTAGLVIFALSFGFGSGANIMLISVCMGQLCETRDLGRYFATCYTVLSIGALTGIPISGVLVQACGGRYWGLIVWTGTCYVIAQVAIGGARICKTGWRLWVKF